MHRRGTLSTSNQEVEAAHPSEDSSKFRRRRKSISFSSLNSSPSVTVVFTVIGVFSVAALIIFLLVQALLFVAPWLTRGKQNSPAQSPKASHRWVEHLSHRRKMLLKRDDHQAAVDDDHSVLPWNPIYHAEDAYPTVGDRSDAYALLRQIIDPELPVHPARSAQRVAELATHAYVPREMDVHNSDQVPYDIYNCPDTPPVGYPFSWNMLRILKNWPPDDIQPRSQIFQSFCIFDYNKDYQKAMTYREAELPFVIINDPEVDRAVERWNHPGYMEELLGDVKHRCERSDNNHFMYFVPPPRRSQRRGASAPTGWKPPTELHRMTYTDWLQKANVSDEASGPDQPHWYFRLIGCGYMGPDGSCDPGSSEYLYDELPFFQPKESLYIVEPEKTMGIHCRFGMKGVIAENHFDGARNMIAVLKGSRRYILAHPDECPNLALYPRGHPSARHSAVDWSDPDLQAFPQFAEAKGNEFVMQPGQVMYLPTNWFHYIISLEMNYQCNTRSGIKGYAEPLHQCGF